jgi:hypothetical protein
MHWFLLKKLSYQMVNYAYDERVETGHHRREKRQIWSVSISEFPALHHQDDWTGLQCLVMVVRVRHLWNQTTHEVQFYLTSLASTTQKLGQVIRQHWGVENSLHWTLDVTFSEDACHLRTGHSPQNLA